MTIIYLLFAYLLLLLPQIYIFNLQNIQYSIYLTTCSIAIISIPFLLVRIKYALLLLLPLFIYGFFEIIHAKYYSGFLSISAVGSIFESNPNEAMEFLEDKLLVLVQIVIAIIIYLYCAYKIDKEASIQRKHKIYSVFFSISIGLSLLLSTTSISQTIEIDTINLKERLKTIYPIASSYNFYAYIKENNRLKKASDQRKNLKTNAYRANTAPSPEIHVLVLGESSAVKTWSVFGSDFNTNPLLSKRTDVVYFPSMLATATVTRNSVPLMLTNAAANDYKAWFNKGSIINAYKETGFSTYWLSNQEKYGRNDTAVSILAEDADESIFINTSLDYSKQYDGELLDLLDIYLNKNNKNKLIVLHTLGSHFSYQHRYPEAFSIFSPNMSTAISTMPNSELQERILNSYYNSIVYTDYIVTEVIKRLDNMNAISTVIYTSDHGERLFEDNEFKFGHGMLNEHIAELRTPFLFWASELYINQFSSKYKNIIANSDKTMNHDVLFHTILDIADIQFSGKQQSLSLASEKFKQDQLYYLNVNNTPKKYISLFPQK